MSKKFLMSAGMAYSAHSPPEKDSRSGLGTRLRAPVNKPKNIKVCNILVNFSIIYSENVSAHLNHLTNY